MMPDHADTRSGWANDRRVILGEGMHEIQCDWPGLVFESVVEERLSTAGLFRRKGQFHTQALEDARHVLEGGGIELVPETGNEQLGFGHHG